MTEGYFRTQCRHCGDLVYEGPGIPPQRRHHIRQHHRGNLHPQCPATASATTSAHPRRGRLGRHPLTAHALPSDHIRAQRTGRGQPSASTPSHTPRGNQPATARTHPHRQQGVHTPRRSHVEAIRQPGRPDFLVSTSPAALECNRIDSRTDSACTTKQATA